MYKTVCAIILYILLSQSIFSQINSFFPLAIGNEYQFVSQYPPFQYSFTRIERDTIYPNSKIYFATDLVEFWDCRVDSSDNLLSASDPYGYSSQEEYLLFKADAVVGEVWVIADSINPLGHKAYGKCIYDDSLYVFDMKRRVKGVLIYEEGYEHFFFLLAKGIGLISFQHDDPQSLMNLNYAKINGVVYGQLVSADEENIVMPMDIIVSQNYPNPFNSITQIEVHLPYSNYNTYKLRIHNILGSLVYEKEFPVKNFSVIRINTDELRLSSGTYFYTIHYADKYITKKFLLLK